MLKVSKLWLFRVILTRVAGYVNTWPNKVVRTKMNPRKPGWWIKVTQIPATQRMTRHLRGNLKKMTLCMCLKSISLCFLDPASHQLGLERISICQHVLDRSRWGRGQQRNRIESYPSQRLFGLSRNAWRDRTTGNIPNLCHPLSDRSWEVSRHLVTMEVRYSFREASKREPTLETSSCSSDSNFNI